MEVDRDEKQVLNNAITEWEKDGMLTSEQAGSLRASIVVRKSDRQQIARYFFFIALCCTMLAFAALFLNEKLLEKIKAYFAWSDVAIAGISALLAIVWFGYIYRKRAVIRTALYEIYMALGGLSMLTSFVYTCKYLHADATYTIFLSLASIALVCIGLFFRSFILWVGALFSVLAWYGVFTTAIQRHFLFLGMNYPMRFVLVGLVLLGVAFLLGRVERLRQFKQMTYIAGLSVFFVALWGVSIFGNYNSFDHWRAVRQVHVLAYSIIMAVISGIVFYFGIRFQDRTARDFGVLFLLVNLYTRYFEYFWDSMNKGIFFLILAVTFGLLGRWLDKKNKAATLSETK